MRNLFKIGLAAALIALAPHSFGAASPVTLPLPAIPNPMNFFCVGTNGGNGGTAAWGIVGPRSASGGAPVVQTISYGTDAAGQLIRGYVVTTNAAVTNWIDTTHVSIDGYTNGLVAGDTLVLYHKATDWCERGKVSTILLTNIVTFAAAPLVNLTNGDTIYRCTNWACPTIFLPQIVTPGSGTNVLNAGGAPLLIGQPGKPLLIEVTGSSACYFGAASGYYTPRPTP